MWFSLSDQTAYFLWSIVMGAAAAALYDLVRAARDFLRAGKLHLLISDVLFFALCGVLTSLFALPFNKGHVRVFILFGEAVGFLCFHLTIGRAAGRFYSILSKAIMSILKKICDLLKLFFDFLLKTTSRVVYNVSVLIERIKRSVSDLRKKRQKSKSARTVRKKKQDPKASAIMRRGGHKKKRRNGYEKRNQKKNKAKDKNKKARRR